MLLHVIFFKKIINFLCAITVLDNIDKISLKRKGNCFCFERVLREWKNEKRDRAANGIGR